MTVEREDLAAVRRLLAALPDRHAQTFAERRAGLDAFGGRGALPEALRIEPLLLDGVAAERIHTDDAKPERALLYLHGGAYVAGSVASHRGFAAFLALEAQAITFTLDYRLAPEHPFPAAVEDAVAACSALRQQMPEGTRLAIAGDSAGGGLAVATALALRDRGEPAPCAVACVSPWLDLTCASQSHGTRAASDPFLTTRGLAQDAATYLAGADARHPLASPLFADLAGLPPLLLQVGGDEILADDARRMEAAAQAAGVPARLEVWPRMFHVWHAFRGLLPEAVEATTSVARFLAARFEAPTSEGSEHGTE